MYEFIITVGISTASDDIMGIIDNTRFNITDNLDIEVIQNYVNNELAFFGVVSLLPVFNLRLATLARTCIWRMCVFVCVRARVCVFACVSNLLNLRLVTLARISI